MINSSGCYLRSLRSIFSKSGVLLAIVLSSACGGGPDSTVAGDPLLLGAAQNGIDQSVSEVAPANSTSVPDALQAAPEASTAPESIFDVAEALASVEAGSQTQEADAGSSGDESIELVSLIEIIESPASAEVETTVVEEPVVSEPVVSEPTVTEPTVTEPTVSEPIVTESVVSEPIVDQATVSEPVATASDSIVNETVEIADESTEQSFNAQGIMQENRFFLESQSRISGEDSRRIASVPGYKVTIAGEIDGLSLTRIADNSAFDVSNGEARHQYSKRQVWNKDETLMDVGNKLIDAESLEIVENYVPVSSERSWSHLDPDTIFGIVYDPLPNKLVAYNVKDRSFDTLWEFSSYNKCSLGAGEGNLSSDDRYVLVTCRENDASNYTAISFDIKNRQIIGQLRLGDHYNWAGFAHSGNYIVVEYSHWSTPDRELLRYDRHLENELLLTTFVEHGDLGLDNNGDDIYAMTDWDYFYYIELETGRHVNLGIAGKDNHMGFGHVSCRALQRPGWCYFSSEVENRVGAVKIGRVGDSASTDTRGRSAYEGESMVELWGFHRSTESNYDAQAKASVSPGGTRLMFTSDWYGNGEINSYQLSLSAP